MAFRKEYERAPEEYRKFDQYAHAVTSIDEPHRMIHDGFMFSLEHSSASLANNGDLDLLITVPAGVFPHIRQTGVRVGDTPCTVHFFEGPTTSANGTALAVYNRNRNSDNTNDVTIYVGPTVSDDGTELVRRLLPASGGFFTPGGASIQGFSEEWILAPSTDYLVRVTNESGAAIDLTVDILWYEIGYES